MESAHAKNCVGRCSQSLSEYEYGECVVGMHVPPIKGAPQVKFKVLDGTEPTLSMPMLVANGNRVVFRGEDAMLITAEGETVPLTSVEDDCYLKVLINKSIEFIRVDVWTPCHVCPPIWVRSLSPEMKQREQYVVRETTGMWDYETVTKPKDNSSPEQTGAAGKTCNAQYEPNAESAISPLEETDILSLSRDEAMDDAELLGDLRGLGKPPLFDRNDTDVSFFPVSEDDSILLRHMDDVVDTGPDKCHRHRAIGEMANPSNQHIEMPQIQFTDKVADESVAVQQQVSPRTTETKTRWRRRQGRPRRRHHQKLLVRREEDGKCLYAAIFLSSLTWRTRSQASWLPRRLGTSCSRMLQRRRQSRTTPRTATQVSHLVSTKRH